jgi:hypothetical protein
VTLGSVASLLAVALYQGNPYRNHKLWNIVSTERYISYAGAAGMLLYMNGKFTMGKMKSSLLSSSFVLNSPSLSISRCRSRYLWYPLFQALCDRCEITKPGII